MDNKNKKKKGGVGIIFFLAMAALFFSGLAEDMDSESIVFFAVVAVIVAAIALIKKVVGSLLGGGAQKDSSPVAAAREGKRHEPRVEIHRAFPEPEAHCVVCDNTGVDHFERDRQMRISQLDDWLKNGVIDKAEYAALKKKYEQS